MTSAPPEIFSKRRKSAREARAATIHDRRDAATFLLEHMAEDIHERLAFLRHQPSVILVEGFDVASVAEGPWMHSLEIRAADPFDFEQVLDFEPGSFDLVTSVNSLDKVNDLPGALIQMRRLLAPGGLALACFIGGASLPKLRRAMFEAEPDRPAARMHPMIDPRSCPQLLARAGWSDPVVDTYKLTVRYSTLDRLVQDLREQALGNVLASPAPPLTRAALERARAAFANQADEDGKVSETFEIVTLTGRRSLASR